MKLMAAALITGLLIPTATHARGNEHIRGTVSALSSRSITVQTAGKISRAVSVAVLPSTRFMKSAAQASMTDLHMGDRVVIHATRSGEKLAAVLVEFGTPHTAMKIREALVQYAAAVERVDLAAIESLWENSDAVTVFESGNANYGWTDYRDHHLKPELGEMKNVKYRLTDIVSHVAGHTAWATMKYTIAADVQSRHIDSAGLATAVLENSNDRWRIVHWHSSAPRKKPAEKSQ